MEIRNPIKDVSVSPNINKIIHFRKIGLIPLLFFLISGLMGCVTFNDPEASQEYSSDQIATINPASRVGQTFISRRPLLNGITIWLSNPPDHTDSIKQSGSKSIILDLYKSPQDSLPLFSTTVPILASGANQPISIRLPSQSRIAGESYYVQLRTDTNTLLVNGRNEDAYPHGQVYIDGNPVEADIAFRLTYLYDFAAVLQDFSDILDSIWLIFPIIVVLWLPGWLLLEFSGLRRRFDFGEEAALSIGISLALTPLIMLWTTIFHIKWSKIGVLFVASLLIGLFFIGLISKYKICSLRKRPGVPNPIRQLLFTSVRSKFSTGIPLLLTLIFLFTLGIRSIMVRDLATPAWVDSVHHALITRQILVQGSYPATYSPYWNFTPTAYHPGFHSIAAEFAWITGLNLSQVLMILGQVLNALATLSVYLLAKTLTRQSSIGLLAAFITGFLTPMPAYYTSWGRFTELTGLLILPCVLALINLLKDLNTRNSKIWIITLGAIVAAGLFMVHYRVVVFMVLLIISCLIFFKPKSENNPSINRKQVMLLVSLMAILSMVFVLPWLYQLVRNTLLPILNSSGGGSTPFFQDFSWSFLTSAMGKQALLIACLGLVWGVITRQRFSYIILFWIFLLFLTANVGALQLPGAGLISNLSVEIMLFMPISILGGYFLYQLIILWEDLIPKQFRNTFLGFCSLLLGLVAILGARQLVTIINPITILSRNADLPAIEWVKENIPEDETIVINPFAWGYGLYAGSDGGYWISPLSGRMTLTPPVLYGLGPDRSRIDGLNQELISNSSDARLIWDFMVKNHLKYLFIGAKGGIISPEKLETSGLFNILYQKDGVWIFFLKP